MDTSKKRMVYGKKNRAIYNSEGVPNLGYLDVVFELVSGELHLVNEKDFFCETRQVFVTSNYHEIESKFQDNELFLIEAVPTVQDWKEGGCRYVTTPPKVGGALPRKAAIQILSAALPSPNERVVFTETPPLTSLVLVKNGEYIYGPFQTEVESDTDGSSSVKLLALEGAFPGKSAAYGGGLRTYKYLDLESGVVHYDIGGDRYSFLIRSDLFNHIECEYKDYASDEEVIKLGSDLLKKVNFKSFTKNEQMLYRTALSKAKGVPNNAGEQLQRFFNIASQMTEKFEAIDSALHDYLQSSKGGELLAQHIDAREEQYLRKFKVEREQLIKSELSSLEDEIEKLLKVQKDLESANQNTAELLEQQNFKLKDQQKIFVDEARNKERNELDSELAKMRGLLADLKEEVGPYQDLAHVKKELSSNSERLNFYREETLTAKQSKLSIEDELNKRNEELRKRLIDLRPYVETISGMVYPVEEETRSLPHAVAREVIRKDLPGERNKYIDEIRSVLAKKGRYYERDFITNLLVSIQQSFIVILSGLPGVGKTSLIKLLGESKMLTSRMLNISVGRGWTSQRDLIGYFNPLSNRMVPAPTGFYSYMKSCQSEVTAVAAPLWVLLDEANLSAIEHYWAPFMGMADSESDKVLRVSEGDKPLLVPDSLRFIGTINNDMTTEPLSPRLIDRAPIITLEPLYDYKDSDFEVIESGFDSNGIPFSHASLQQMFDIDSDLDLEHERAAISHQMDFFQKVKSVLMDNDISLGKRCVISKRKENAIEKYCLVAHPLMRSTSNMLALDYAISQHVLPLIQGSGDGYGMRLEKLLNVLNKDDFKISNAVLHRIHEAGKMDMYSFNYFS